MSNPRRLPVDATCLTCAENSYLAATEILTSPKKDRVRVIEFFVEGTSLAPVVACARLMVATVAKSLAALRNYNSLMALIAALNMNSIARMRKTWSKVNAKLLTDLEQLEARMQIQHRMLKLISWSCADADGPVVQLQVVSSRHGEADAGHEALVL